MFVIQTTSTAPSERPWQNYCFVLTTQRTRTCPVVDPDKSLWRHRGWVPHSHSQRHLPLQTTERQAEKENEWSHSASAELDSVLLPRLSDKERLNSEKKSNDLEMEWATLTTFYTKRRVSASVCVCVCVGVRHHSHKEFLRRRLKIKDSHVSHLQVSFTAWLGFLWKMATT